MINNQELLIKNIIYSCEPLFFILISLINDKLQQNTVGILYDSTKLIYCTFTFYSMWKIYMINPRNIRHNTLGTVG